MTELNDLKFKSLLWSTGGWVGKLLLWHNPSLAALLLSTALKLHLGSHWNPLSDQLASGGGGWQPCSLFGCTLSWCGGHWRGRESYLERGDCTPGGAPTWNASPGLWAWLQLFLNKYDQIHSEVHFLNCDIPFTNTRSFRCQCWKGYSRKMVNGCKAGQVEHSAPHNRRKGPSGCHPWCEGCGVAKT